MIHQKRGIWGSEARPFPCISTTEAPNVKFCVPVNTWSVPWIFFFFFTYMDLHMWLTFWNLFNELHFPKLKHLNLKYWIWTNHFCMLCNWGEIFADGFPLMVDIHIWSSQASSPYAATVWLIWSAKNIYISIEDIIFEISIAISILYCLQCNCHWLFSIVPWIPPALNPTKNWCFWNFLFSKPGVMLEKKSPNIWLWISWGLAKAKMGWGRVIDPGLMSCHALSP